MKLNSKCLINQQVMESIQTGQLLIPSLDGQTQQQVLGFSNQTLFELYKAAQGLIERERYSDASDAFAFLTLLAPHSIAFLQGLALSEQRNNHLEEAVGLYLYVIGTGRADRSVYLEAVRCCITAGKPEEALTVLNSALEYAVEHPEDLESVNLHHTSVQCQNWVLEHRDEVRLSATNGQWASQNIMPMQEEEVGKDGSIEALADAAVELLMKHYDSLVEPAETSATRFKNEIVERLMMYRNRWAHGYQILIEELTQDEPVPPSQNSPIIWP